MSDAARKPYPPVWALVAAVLGSSMSFIDGSAVNVAMPVLQRDLHASSASAQWVIESYSLFLSALILIGGALGDMYGRRLAYGAGIAVFAVASLVCAIAPNVEILIAGRCIQGIGGALATPGSLALISASYDGAARGRAIGTWSAMSAITAAIGPVIGGALVQLGSWRWVFVINVPLALVVLAILALRTVESRDPGASRSVDLAGATLATGGLGALVYGLIRLQGGALDAAGIACVSAGVVALAVFVAVEARVRHPMLQLALFASRRFSLANAYTLLVYAAIGGSLYFIPFDLINVQGYPPSLAGAALVPMVVIVFALSRTTGGLVPRIGAGPLLAAGAVFAACGFATFAAAGVGRPYWATFLPGSILLGCGAACFAAPITTTVMGAVEATHAGIASGINNAVSRAAGLIAIAVLGISLATAFESTLSRELVRRGVSAQARAVVAADRAQIVAAIVPPEITAPGDRAIIGAAIRRSYANGFAVAMIASALLCIAAVPIALDRSFRRDAKSR